MYSQINRTREALATVTSGDEFERLQLASDRDVLLHAVTHQSATLHQMHGALHRLESDSYGFCVSCEEAISPKRLQAIPWVAYCLRCQEDLERSAQRNNEDFLRQAA
jgi:DnaK suppressor protein